MIERYDASKLISNEKGLQSDEVINGIAYNNETKKFILTGKHWKNFYEVSL